MDVVLVLGAIAVVGALIVRAGWRHAVDERQSVKDYHQALETLRHLSDRRSGAAAGPPEASGGDRRPAAPRREEIVRSETFLGRTGAPGNGVAPRPPAPVPAGAFAAIARAVAARSAPPAAPGADESSVGDGDGQLPQPAAAGAPPDHEPARALVFDAEGPVPPPAGAEERSLPAESRFSRVRIGKPFKVPRALRRRPPRNVVFSAATVLLLVALTAAVIVVVSTGSHSSTARSGAPSVVSHHPRQGPRPAASSRGNTTPSTSAPQTLQPTTSSATQASYTAPSSSYTVEVSASGPCWVLVSATDSGKELWTGTLQGGQTQQIPVTGGVSVRLGAAFNATVTANGVPVSLPSGHGSPFNVAFTSA